MSSRRTFISNGSKLVAGGLLLNSVQNNMFARGIWSSDQVNIGVIGIKGQGFSDLKAALTVPGVNLIAICDVDKNVIDTRMAELQKSNVDVSKIKVYGDYRRLLDQKDIDAVIIGTPDHWHALQMIQACEAGKHIFVEKPIGNSIAECDAMVAAQQYSKRVVQVGQWQRSQQHFKDAVDFLHTGQLGNVRTVKVWCYQGWMKPAAKQPDSVPPAGVDYKMWLGPAPARAFNASRFHFNFRWFWDYAGGLMTDWGVHLMDYALHGMGADVPKTISALGGKFAYPDLAEETPDTLTALYEFDKFNIVWDHAMGIDNGSYNRDHGIAYIGNNGTLILNRGGWEVISERQSGNKVEKPLVKPSDNGLIKHMENFIGVIRSGKMEELNASIQVGAHVAKVSQMGNIAFRTQQKLEWNKSKGKFTTESVNDEYLAKKYHNGYKFPVVKV
ncbi:MAG: Gfo/Idh/MocA family oxidoreductase [Chitinophagaceae bacterium]